MNDADRERLLSVTGIGIVSLGLMLIHPTASHRMVMLFLFLFPLSFVIFGRRLWMNGIGADDYVCPIGLRLMDSLYQIGAVLTLGALALGVAACVNIGLFVAAFALWLNALLLLLTFHVKRRQTSLLAWSLYLFSAVLAVLMPVVLLQALFGAQGSAWPPDWIAAPSLLYAYALPCVGMVCEILDRCVPKQFLGRRSTLAAFGMTAVLAVATILVAGLFPFSFHPLIRSMLELLTLVPFTILLLNAGLTLASGCPRIHGAMFYAFIFLGVYSAAHLSGIALALPVMGFYLGGTAWATAHLFLLSVTGAGIAFLAGVDDERAQDVQSGTFGAKFSLFVLVCSFPLLIIPLWLLGGLGFPRDAAVSVPIHHALRALSTEAGLFFFAGYLIAMGNRWIPLLKTRLLAPLVMVLCLATGASATTPAESTPASPEDLGPAQIDVSHYPPEMQKTYTDIFLNFSKYAGAVSYTHLTLPTSDLV